MEYFDTILEDKIPLKIIEIDEKEYDCICVMTDLHGTYKAFEKVYTELEKTFSFNKKVLYITERAVFELRREGLTLVEIADGIDIEKDIIANMEFKPILANEIKKMNQNIFFEKPMGLKFD